MDKVKKFILLILLIGVGISMRFFYVSQPDNSILENVKGVFSALIDPKAVDTGCELEDEISYLFYTEQAKNDSRNNKFGLYIYAEEERFIVLADQLVNSNGGDWGYVLIPYNVKDRDSSKWGRVFTQLRKKHLIPVIQLHDVDPPKYKSQTDGAARFLNKFLWPTKERYISVYNEPNDASFWKTGVDPKGYAQILDYTIDVFKEENPAFFIMNGALNVSAPTNSRYLESFSYMKAMDTEVPGIFEKLDGWASHPYPQPNFSGSPTASGRWSIRAYEDELKYLRESLGVKKELPVFITETGWAHAEGKIYDSSFLPVLTTAENFKIAYTDVWLKDGRVRAVMPFTIRYDSPFDYFSWIDHRNIPYAHFQVVKSLKKIAGNPPHLSETTSKSLDCVE